MQRLITLAPLAVFLLTGACAGSDPTEAASKSGPFPAESGDWPWWRGPQHNGIAEDGQQPPVTWSDSENIRWKTAVPGRSHGSPIVVGDQVLVTIANHARDVQSVMCLNESTGALTWETVVHRGGLDVKSNEKSTMASTAPACDGERIFVNFLNGDSVYVTALDRSGQQLWQQRVCGYVNHQGFGASPVLYGDLVISVADNNGGGAIAALDRTSGSVVWKKDRPAKPNYPSAVVFNVAGRDQLLLTGCDLVTSLDPSTGETIWETAGATTECVTTTVTDGTHIFTSGGYPENHISAITADGSAKQVWKNDARVYVPSMLLDNGRLYGVLDAGIASCWDSSTGRELWKGRLGGTFSSSPVMCGNLIYATSEDGTTHVFRKDTDGLEVVGRNKLGDNVFATPAICRGRIYQRIATQEGNQRQEFVVCIGAE
jgi:hypothetical protein